VLAEAPQNAALSLLRFASGALVQEPQMWQFILDRAAAQADKLDTPIARDAVQALRAVFAVEPPISRVQLRQLAERFLGEEPRSTTRMSAKALAGQTLLSALRESPARAVAQ
jgi:hypothetical protein